MIRYNQERPQGGQQLRGVLARPFAVTEALLRGEPRAALNAAMVAVQGLPQGTPEWIRAQDIVELSRNRAQDEKKRGRNER